MELEHMEAIEQVPDAMANVEELLKILIENNQQQAAQSVAFMMEFMNSMGEELTGVTNELKSVREELNVLKDTPETATIKERLSNMAKNLEQKVISLQKQIKDMQGALNEKAAEVIDNFKRQGIKALANVTKVLGIKKMLTSIQKSFEKQFEKIEASLGRIDEAERKYREVAMHVKNAGRTLKGKDIQKEVVFPEKSVFVNLRKPYQSMKNIYVGGRMEVRRALAKLTYLERAGKQVAKKLPIAEKLKNFKESQGKLNKDNKRDIQQTVKRKGEEHGR